MASYPFPRANSFYHSFPSTPKREKVEDDRYSPPLEMPMTREDDFKKPRRVRKIIIAFVALALLFFLLWRPSRSMTQSDKIPFSHDTVEDLFAHFEGHQECAITAPSLYTPPQFTDATKPRHSHFCPNRASLLESMSDGGRHGFDAPYRSASCHYRWYSATEICMILDRFDGVVFIGDDMLQSIYAAFNVLLREDIATGGLKQWELEDGEKEACRCDNQIIKGECTQRLIQDSAAIGSSKGQNDGLTKPYFCSRIPHFFLPISGSPALDDQHERFTNFLRGDQDSYKPIAVIHTLGLSTGLSWSAATESMDEWVGLADASGRNVPFLWLGPNSAGHLKPPGLILGEGNNALWHYTHQMANEAHARELDTLGMYNLTLQATSWDGSSYGLRVGIVQAMMIINWLSRVEST